MARINNVAVRGTSGAFGKDIVYKSRGNKTFISKYPDRTNVTSSKNQTKGRDKFAAAVKFAQSILKDKKKRTEYLVETGKSVYATAIKDYMNAHSAKSIIGPGKFILIESELFELGLNERQVKAILYANRHSIITNAIYQQINDISKATATRDLQMLVQKSLLKTNGIKGAGAEYIIGSLEQ